MNVDDVRKYIFLFVAAAAYSQYVCP